MPEARPVGVLLAAGRARRFGSDKLLAPLPGTGEPVAVAAARRLVAAVPDSLAVVRDAEGSLARRLAALGLNVVPHPDPDAGMGTSIVCAVRHRPEAAGWVIALADMPWIAPTSIRAVADALTQGALLAAPCHAGRRGHPVAFAAAHREALLSLKGDRGGRSLLETHARQLVSVTVQDPGVLVDIDTPSDLNRRGTG